MLKTWEWKCPKQDRYAEQRRAWTDVVGESIEGRINHEVTWSQVICGADPFAIQAAQEDAARKKAK